MTDVYYAATVIENMAEEWYRPPSRYHGLKRKWFEYYSYQHWAVTDIRDYVLQHPYQHPLDSVLRYKQMMDKAACETNGGSSNFIFTIAVDIAVDVYDVLREAL